MHDAHTTGPQGFERRAHGRSPVHEVPAFLGFYYEVTLVNLSPTGMGVRSPNPIPVGRRYCVRFDLDSRGLTLGGTVRWCCLRRLRPLADGDSEPVYEGGIAFDAESCLDSRHVPEATPPLLPLFWDSESDTRAPAPGARQPTRSPISTVL